MLCIYAFTKGMMNIIKERKDKKRVEKSKLISFLIH